MKKSIIIATMALAALTGVTSCGDFLDKEPSNELTKEKTFSGWKTAQQFHWDTYNFLLHGALRVNNSWLDAATDLAECAIPTGGTRTSFNIGNYYGGGGAAEFTSVWESRYRGIRKCNMTLEMVDSVPKPVDETEELYQSERAQLISEARFFRACRATQGDVERSSAQPAPSAPPTPGSWACATVLCLSARLCSTPTATFCRLTRRVPL